MTLPLWFHDHVFCSTGLLFAVTCIVHLCCSLVMAESLLRQAPPMAPNNHCPLAPWLSVILSPCAEPSNLLLTNRHGKGEGTPFPGLGYKEF